MPRVMTKAREILVSKKWKERTAVIHCAVAYRGYSESDDLYYQSCLKAIFAGHNNIIVVHRDKCLGATAGKPLG